MLRRTFTLALAVVALPLASLAADDAKSLRDISFDDLKFDIKPASRFEQSMFTDEIKALDGQPIRIRGVMWPTFQQKGIKEFVLLMNKECQFGSAKDPVWCNIRVLLDDEESASFTTGPVTVEGELNLDVMKGQKYDISVYLMKDAKVTK
jgi:hypothetical protein